MVLDMCVLFRPRLKDPLSYGPYGPAEFSLADLSANQNDECYRTS